MPAKFPKERPSSAEGARRGAEGRKHPVPQKINRIYGFCALALDAIIPSILPPLPALDAIGKDEFSKSISLWKAGSSRILNRRKRLHI